MIALSSVPAGFADPDGPTTDDLVKCVRCGLCLGSCPTYQVLGLETDSPRGRVHLMRGVGDGRLTLGESVIRHLDQCLGCRACETICPSDVPYGRLLEATRGVIERQRPTSGWRGALQRFAFRRVLPSRRVVGLAASLLRLAQRTRLDRLGRRLMPDGVAHLASLAPQVDGRPYRVPRGVASAIGPHRGQASLFLGCVMPALFGPAQQDSEDLLRYNGFDVVSPPEQTCCGALMAHAGERDQARDLARRNLAAFEGDDPIIVNSAGCGALLKEYGELLAGDPTWAERAAAFSARVRDISEFLADVGMTARLGPITRTVTYQDACHLIHAQRVARQPRALLRQIPGLELVELPGSDRCCGSAGIYNLTHPNIAGTLRESKVDDIAATGAEVLAVGNPGCLIQIGAGLRERGLTVETVHTVTLLAEACRRGSPGSPATTDA